MTTKEKDLSNSTAINFGTGGFRGVIGDSFTKDNVQKICQSIANICQKENLKKEIFIGYDNRFMSEQFAEYCCEVFVANGFLVNLNKNACATPVVMYETMKHGNDYGLMITASHNPYEYNGVKIFTKDGKDASVEDTKKIETEFKNLKVLKYIEFCECKSQIKFVDYIEEFVNYIINNQGIPNCEGVRVVFDTKFGSTAEELKLFCEKINLDYSIINEKRDAFFNFTLPAPSGDNVEQLKNEVLKNGCDIGFALDADGDRLAIIDEKGNFIDNNIILSLVYYYLVKYENKNGGVVKNVATSSLLNILADKFNQTCYEVPVGFKYISSKLIETNSVVGGESSGGLALQNHIWGKDSLISIAICLKILKKFNKPFSEIIKDLLEFADGYNKTIIEKQYRYSAEKEKLLKDFLFKRKKLPVLINKTTCVIYKDYVKLYYTDNNWVVVRFSGTEPVLRIFVEHNSFEECQKEIALWGKFLNL